GDRFGRRRQPPGQERLVRGGLLAVGRLGRLGLDGGAGGENTQGEEGGPAVHKRTPASPVWYPRAGGDPDRGSSLHQTPEAGAGFRRKVGRGRGRAEPPGEPGALLTRRARPAAKWQAAAAALRASRPER